MNQELIQLKASAYDVIHEIEMLQRTINELKEKLSIINSQISQLNDQN